MNTKKYNRKKNVSMRRKKNVAGIFVSLILVILLIGVGVYTGLAYGGIAPKFWEQWFTKSAPAEKTDEKPLGSGDQGEHETPAETYNSIFYGVSDKRDLWYITSFVDNQYQENSTVNGKKYSDGHIVIDGNADKLILEICVSEAKHISCTFSTENVLSVEHNIHDASYGSENYGEICFDQKSEGIIFEKDIQAGYYLTFTFYIGETFSITINPVSITPIAEGAK